LIKAFAEEMKLEPGMALFDLRQGLDQIDLAFGGFEIADHGDFKIGAGVLLRRELGGAICMGGIVPNFLKYLPNDIKALNESPQKPRQRFRRSVRPEPVPVPG